MHYRLSIPAAILSIAICAPASAATVVFSDGIFSLPPWTSVTTSGANGGQISSQATAGGSPGSFLSVTTTTNSETFTAHTNAGFVYDPALGAIDTIDVSLDYRNIISFGEGHGVGAVVAVQDGNVFVAGRFITGSTNFDWQNYSLNGLTANNFSLVAGAGVLDFAGSPITFGFETRNSGGSGINVGYDNYSVSLHVVPVPAALPMLTGALALLGWMRRR